MACYYPITAYRAKRPNPETGKRPLVFNKNDGFSDLQVTIPCGRCIGCRLEYSRQWAIRCMHEASMYDENCMITLTYDNENLPRDSSLDKTDFQKFMKRLRKQFQGKSPVEHKGKTIYPIRYYMCGEYGDQYGRPHYHAIMFNFNFDDRVYRGQSPSGHAVYESQTLSDLWGLGRVEIGSVSFESAAYVARYVMKKALGSSEESEIENFQYSVWDIETGALIGFKEPEYCNSSRGFGIASKWFEKFSGDVFPKDSISIRGKEMKPPKYYLSQFELDAPDEVRKIKLKRKKEAEKHEDDNTLERLKTREKVKRAQLSQLPRNLQ